ncbi:hypothetical protein BGW42_006418, partial [Actinomortierella wolfii]
MFEKDENENESPPNPTSFLDDLHPRVGLESIFGHALSSQEEYGTGKLLQDHEDGDDDGADDMQRSQDDDNASTSGRTDGTGSSLGESDQSFEVSVHASNSEGSDLHTEDSSERFSFGHGSSAFGSDIPSSDSSDDDDENSTYMPNLEGVERSSGVGLHPDVAEALLGPPVSVDDGDHTADMSLVDSTQTYFPDIDREDTGTGASFPDNEELEDHSLYRFKNHRSSLPGRSAFTPEPNESMYNDGDDSMEMTNCIGGIVDVTQQQSQTSMQEESKQASEEKSEKPPKSPAFGTPNTDWAQDDMTDMDITTPIGVGIHADSLVDMTAPFESALDDITAELSDVSAMDITQPIGAGILESQTPKLASQETSQVVSQDLLGDVDVTGEPDRASEAMDEDTQTRDDVSSSRDTNNSLMAHRTSTGLGKEIIEREGAAHRESLPSEQNNGVEMPPPSTPPRRKSRPSFSMAGDVREKRMMQSSESTAEPTSSPPSTPPRRTSHNLLGSPTPGTPRRGLATPASFTPSTKARYHVFPEIFERQLKDARPSSTAPAFNNNHTVSPETSNLAKRIARYSAGATTSFDTLLDDVSAEKRRNTFDVDTGRLAEASALKHSSSVSITASKAESVANDLRAIARTKASEAGDSGQSVQREEAASKSMVPPPPRTQEATAKITEESTAMEQDEEDEPIPLKTFLSLVGISFMDNLQSVHRRRTLLAEPKPSTTYAVEDYVKAMAILTPELDQYKSSCENAKSYIEESRSVVQDIEAKVDAENPEFFAEYLEGEPAFQEFMRERFRMIKVHSRLAATEAWYQWREDMIKIQMEAFEHNLSKLKEDRAKISGMVKEAARVHPGVVQRYKELKRQLEQARERQQAFAQCDKEQLASLAEAIEEQGNQLNLFKRKLAGKTNELMDLTQKVEQLRVVERTERAHIAAAEKTIKDHQYIKASDLARAKDQLATLQAIHLWRPLPPSSSSAAAAAAAAAAATSSTSPNASQSLAKADRVVRLVFDESLLVKVDLEKLLAGKRLEGVQITEYGGSEPDPLESFQASRRFISSIPAPKPKPLAEFVGLLRDFITEVVEKYKTETTIQRIMADVSTFWMRVKHIRHEIQLIRAHHVVDLVAGSRENLEELQQSQNDHSPSVAPFPSPPHHPVTRQHNEPIVVLDIRVRFNVPISGKRDQPAKFYVWFTFTLNDLLSFPAPDSFSWRIEIVHGEINVEPIRAAIGLHSKDGGFGVLQKICQVIRQLLM